MDSFSSDSHAVPSEIQNPSNGDYYSIRRIVKSNCRTEEVQFGKFVRKCEKTEEVLKDCLGKNQYDIDVTTWSPAGRLFQVEYVMEAVKQGSTAIGLRSKTHVVLGCVNKGQSELSSHQRKIFKVDDHIGVTIASLTADDRVLSWYIMQLADKAQVCTQRSWKRPYCLGLLLGGMDETGAHLYYSCPSGNYFEYEAFAIGSHSQAANTYLECRFETFKDASRDEMIKHALLP